MSLRSSSTFRIAAIALFIALLLGSRGCRLGDKPLHHDESLFGYYSFYLAEYGEYDYDPILHGPLLLELVAAAFRVFGDSDFTLRLVPMLCGLALFPLLLALGPWLGRRGVLAALLLLLASPNLCYYSRFLRNDMLFLMLTMVNLVAIAYTLRGRSGWPIVLWPASLALLISNKENIVFLATSQLGFAFLWIALDDRRLAAQEREWDCYPVQKGENAVWALRRLNVALVIWCVIAWIYAVSIRQRVPLGGWAVPLWIVGVLTTAAWIDALFRAFRHDPNRCGLVYRLHRSLFTERYWWIVGGAVFVAIIYFCFSIALTKPQPMLGSSGLIAQTVGYWWGEHASERLGGAFHVYAPQILLYEVPAWIILFAALLRDWQLNFLAGRRWLELGIWLYFGLMIWEWSLLPFEFRPEWLPESIQDPVRTTMYTWLSDRLRENWDYIHIRSIGALFWAASVAYWGLIWTFRSIRTGYLVRGWFIFWLMTSYLFYGYAGEKVPWLALHIVLPLLLLAALLWSEWSRGCRDRRRWNFVAALMAALLLWNGWQTFILCFANPTNPAEIAVYNHTHYEAKDMANKLVRWIDEGSVSEPSRTIVQGEASWPWTWYLRRYPSIQFAGNDFAVARTDEVVVADPGIESTRPTLLMDFDVGYFSLRYAWIPPKIPWNELLCLRAAGPEPDGLWGKVRTRVRRTTALLGTFGQYLLFRRAYSDLPPPPGGHPFGFVECAFWVRARATPETLMPPDSDGMLPPDFDGDLGGRTVIIEEGLWNDDPTTGLLKSTSP